MSLRGLFLEIAEAIREREGSGAGIAAADFAERIRSLPEGSGIELQSLSILTPPEKTCYYYNCFGAESFQPQGMELRAGVGDGSRSFFFALGAPEIGFEPAGALTAGTQAVSAAQAVEVLHRSPSWDELSGACASWAALMALVSSWRQLEEL